MCYLDGGIPMFPIGLTWYYFGVEIGTDPLCFMGWNNYTKYPFFIHIYTMLGISIILSVIILCNNSSPETRKDSMIDDLRSRFKSNHDVLFGNFHSNRLRKFKRMTTKEMRLKNKERIGNKGSDDWQSEKVEK
ncbi:unnamed protein product [Lepeophtheirus salmonis]|uniref:(salmon louse) hypothetical protein n=1 Tax=Lepeophtheirus salmonis TaxID=72036 RepID=A0A7R8CLN0_LEPSM|nr:unnamed protein product [Lepeophtheirus salmonis]CAF2860003.1 unnamed protein product [Lepeophtheirus salmonis]